MIKPKGSIFINNVKQPCFIVYRTLLLNPAHTSRVVASNDQKYRLKTKELRRNNASFGNDSKKIETVLHIFDNWCKFVAW